MAGKFFSPLVPYSRVGVQHTMLPSLCISQHQAEGPVFSPTHTPVAPTSQPSAPWVTPCLEFCPCCQLSWASAVAIAQLALYHYKWFCIYVTFEAAAH